MIPSLDEYFIPENIEEATWISEECDNGNVEYKLTLVDLNQEQFNHRGTQMNWRLNEGSDKAIYKIGYMDCGRPIGLSRRDLTVSLQTLSRISKSINCRMDVVKILRGENGFLAVAVIRRREHTKSLPENIPVAMVGPFASGKSSLLGVLMSGQLDNGRGLARMQVFSHQHEVQSGKTSSVTRRRLCFNKSGKVLNEMCEGSHLTMKGSAGNRQRSLSDVDILTESTKIITLIDLAGHEKYFKTTVHGLVSQSPQFCILTVPASTTPGVAGLTTEYLGIAVALNVSLIVVITKADLVTEEASAITAKYMMRVMKSCNSGTVVIAQDSDLHKLQEAEKPLVPIFVTSSLSGLGIALLRSYLFSLSTPIVAPPPLLLYSGSEGLKPPSPPIVDLSQRAEVNIFSMYHMGEKSLDNDPTGNRTASSALGGIAKEIGRVEEEEGYDSWRSEPGQLEELSVGSGKCVVVEGLIRAGQGVSVGDEMYFGPDKHGDFALVSILSLQVSRVPVPYASAGQTATICVSWLDEYSPLHSALRPSGTHASDFFSTSESLDIQPLQSQQAPDIGPDSVLPQTTSITQARCSDFYHNSRQGRFLLGAVPSEPAPRGYREFDAEIMILHHPNKIAVNYQPMIHIGVVRQCARLISFKRKRAGSVCDSDASDPNPDDEDKYLHTGDSALCRFRFLYFPEYFSPGMTVVIREGRTRGVGKIILGYSS